jgi:hypothetical protein
MSSVKVIAVDERTTYTEQRTEYVVYIPEDAYPLGRRQVGRYAASEPGEGPGEQRALEHVAYLHRAAVERPSEVARRAEAFAVEQVITTTERRL